MSNARETLNRLPAGTAGFVDHIGIAVSDLDAGIRLYSDLLGLELERIEEVPAEQIRVAFLKLDRTGTRGHVELLAPTGAGGAVARFLAKHGPGLHHIALAADDLATLIARCRAAGLRLLDDKPRTGAGDKRIVFVHPHSADGVLIEICASPTAE